MTSEDLQGERLHNLSGKSVPVLGPAHSTEVLCGVQTKPPVSHFVPTASCSVTGHHCKEPGSILFGPSLQFFIYIDKIPLSFLLSRLKPFCAWLIARSEGKLSHAGPFAP